MKSKSPFAMKSPLLAYKSDMKGNYANPEYVPETIVGAEIGANIAKTAASVFDSYANSKKSAQSDSKKAFDDLANTKSTKFDSGLNTDFSLKGKGTSPTSEVFNTKTQGGKQVLTHEANADKLGYKKNTKERSDFIDASTKFNLSEYKTDTPTNDGKTKNYINMKGSPVKHNAGAVGSIASGGGQNNQSKSLVALFGQDKANNMQQKMTAMKSQQSGSGIFGTIAQAASQGGSGVGSFNREGILAADTSVDASLPPPNQVAETGSYGGGGDRILEMDSNPVGNQSIGRDTDIASQLFGSGQRASMLAMKGTPLHHDSEKQAHTHPSKTTTKMKPDGEYPGARYVKGDLVDQDDLLDKTKLDAHIATQVQSDKKGTFIKEKSDDGPGSDIETSKGFGKKIRLGSMGRSSYTSNMKDQLDPNNFLFKNTPKK